MLKKACLAVVAMGFAASFANAEVLLNYEPTMIDIDATDGPYDVAISVTGNSGFDGLTSAVIFDFDGLDALNPVGFVWDGSPDFDNPNQWFTDATLPAPSAVSFGATLPVVGGEVTPLATLSIDPQNTGDFVVTDGATVGDENAAPLDVKSGPTTFSIVPEPASLGLLAMGALAAIRRRR